MTESIQAPDSAAQPATKSTRTPDQATQLITESAPLSDPAVQALQDGIATAVKRLRRIDDDLENIESFVYVSLTALRAPEGDDAIADIATVLEAAYVQLVEHVGDDVRNALKALDQVVRARSDEVTARDHCDG